MPSAARALESVRGGLLSSVAEVREQVCSLRVGPGLTLLRIQELARWFGSSHLLDLYCSYRTMTDGLFHAPRKTMAMLCVSSP